MDETAVFERLIDLALADRWAKSTSMNLMSRIGAWQRPRGWRRCVPIRYRQRRMSTLIERRARAVDALKMIRASYDRTIRACMAELTADLRRPIDASARWCERQFFELQRFYKDIPALHEQTRQTADRLLMATGCVDDLNELVAGLRILLADTRVARARAQSRAKPRKRPDKKPSAARKKAGKRSK